MNVPNVSKKAHAHFRMNFIGQCVVANAHGKFRVMKSITKPTSGFLKIVNGEYLPPTYTPPTPPTNNTNNTSNDPIIGGDGKDDVQVQTISTDGTLSAINLKVKLVNNDTTSLTFYAHATTYGSVGSDYDTLTGYNNIVSPIEVIVDAMSTQSNYTFLFDKVIIHDHVGRKLEFIENDNTNPYYIYVFVQDSDGDRIIHKETINR